MTRRATGRMRKQLVERAWRTVRVTLSIRAYYYVRIVSEDGELLRHLTLDPSRSYQPLTLDRRV